MLFIEESSIENKLRKDIKKLGRKALKFVSPGMSGVPDRIVLLPEGKIIFVELKALGKKTRHIQKYRFKELRTLGFDVRVIDSVEGVDKFIKEVILLNLNIGVIKSMQSITFLIIQQ